MTSEKLVLTESTWVRISNEEDYFFQNIGSEAILIKASAGTPTDDNGSFILGNADVLSSTVLPGVIYAKGSNTNKDSLATLAK